MNPETRRKALLIAFGALLLIGAWRSLQPLLRDEEPVPAAARPSSIAGNAGIRPGDRLATLHLASLDRPSPGSATAGRDLWSFVDPPARRQPETATAFPPRSENPPAPVTEPALNPPPQPTVSLKYLGNFGPAGKKIAVLSNGQQIYNALEGDVIDGKYIVARIGYESVDIRFVDFPDLPAQRVGVRQR